MSAELDITGHALLTADAATAWAWLATVSPARISLDDRSFDWRRFVFVASHLARHRAEEGDEAEGRGWAEVGAYVAEALAARSGDRALERLARRLRGWSAQPSPR